MRIHVSYLAQLKQAAGRTEETLSLEEGSTLPRFAQQLIQRCPGLAGYVTACGAEAPPALVFVNDFQRGWLDATPLEEGDRIVLLSPMAGG